MDISTLSLLSILSFCNHFLNDTTKLPLGNWVTENFEVISIDTLERSSNVLSNTDGKGISGSDIYISGDTLRYQAIFYVISSPKDTIVDKYDFLILKNQIDSLFLKPISPLAIELMRTDQVMIFTCFGTPLDLNDFVFEEFHLFNEKYSLRINSQRDIFLTVTSWASNGREAMMMDWSKVGSFKGALNEIEYQEFLKVLKGTGITQGYELNNNWLCSHCYNNKLHVRVKGQAYKFKFDIPKPIFNPLNKLINKFMKHDSLKRVNE